MRKREDLTGKTFNLLTVLRHVAGQHWLCRCQCGAEATVLSYALKSGNTKSCGCLRSGRPAAPIPVYGLGLPWGVSAVKIDDVLYFIVWDMRNPNVHKERARFASKEAAIAWHEANPQK